MINYKYLLIVVSVVFVVGSTFSVLYLLGPNKNKTSIEIASPFVESSLQPVSQIMEDEKPEPNKTSEEKIPKTIEPSKAGEVNAIKANDLESKITALEKRIEELEKNETTNTTATTISSDPNKVKEYFIYLGSGSTTNRDWTQINSASSFIDTNNYGKIKSASFEAAMSIVGGEVHARIKNKNSGSVIYNSEIFNNTSSSIWKQSTSLSLSSGNVEYVVELKSTSGEKANLDGARIRIVVE